MSQSKLFNVILIFCMLWLAFSGTGAANQALAQTPPPTISSEGEKEHQLTTQQPPVQAFEAEPASDDARQLKNWKFLLRFFPCHIQGWMRTRTVGLGLYRMATI